MNFIPPSKANDPEYRRKVLARCFNPMKNGHNLKAEATVDGKTIKFEIDKFLVNPAIVPDALIPPLAREMENEAGLEPDALAERYPLAFETPCSIVDCMNRCEVASEYCSKHRGFEKLDKYPINAEIEAVAEDFVGELRENGDYVNFSGEVVKDRFQEAMNYNLKKYGRRGLHAFISNKFYELLGSPNAGLLKTTYTHGEARKSGGTLYGIQLIVESDLKSYFEFRS